MGSFDVRWVMKKSDVMDNQALRNSCF
jgi:hypothetical protein